MDEAWCRHVPEGESGAFVKYKGNFEEDMTRNCAAGRVFPGKCTRKGCRRKSTHTSEDVLLPRETRIKIQRLADELAVKAGVQNLKVDLEDATGDL